jgi:hypothetical protein
MIEAGLACLSPGFTTQDPAMRERLQQSLSVRDQQRHIIESRLQRSAKLDDPSSKESPFGGQKTAGLSRRRGPAGLSIVAPSAQNFATERVIQSAPLNQSFTGLQRNLPLARQVVDRPSNLSQTSHIHNVPTSQNMNRLPPISDVFAGERLSAHRTGDHPPPAPNGFFNREQPASSSNAQSSHRTSFPSPGQQTSHLPPPSAGGRPREYRSAEEAVAQLTGGREDLLPKVVHYNGNPHPPTPPSPGQGPSNGYASSKQTEMNGLRSGRRRARAEYERDNGSPPLGNGPERSSRGWAEREEDARKKDEFLSLCSRAWDLFHS